MRMAPELNSFRKFLADLITSFRRQLNTILEGEWPKQSFDIHCFYDRSGQLCAGITFPSGRRSLPIKLTKEQQIALYTVAVDAGIRARPLDPPWMHEEPSIAIVNEEWPGDVPL